MKSLLQITRNLFQSSPEHNFKLRPTVNDFEDFKVVGEIEVHRRTSFFSKSFVTPITADLFGDKNELVCFADFVSLFNNSTKSGLKENDRMNLTKRILEGNIPAELRPHIWLLMANCLDGEYKAFTSAYKRLSPLLHTCKDTQQIRFDIQRLVLPQSDEIASISKGEKPSRRSNIDRLIEEEISIRISIFRVLAAYSLFNPKIGYVQGMSGIAANIVYNFLIAKGINSNIRLNVDVSLEEDGMFALFANIMEHYNLKSLYQSRLEGLTEMIGTLEERMKSEIPKVYAKLCSSGVYIPITLSILFHFT